MQKLHLLVSFIAVILLSACSDSSDPSGQQAPERFAVSVLYETYVDNSRVTPATGDGEYPELPNRTLETTIIMPEGEGPFPLVIFSHGLGASPQAYEALTEAVAAGGFVVVAPLFPLTGANAPAGADPADNDNQPGDISFLIDVVTNAVANNEAPFADKTDVAKIGAFGHSNGGITTLGVMANSCCRDDRIDAAAPLSGVPSPLNGVYDFSNTAPMLLVHGTEDVLAPYEESVRTFNAMESAKGILTLNDIGHGEFLAPSGQGFDSTVNSIIDFFAAQLTGDAQAETRLKQGITYDTGAELLYTADGGSNVTLPLPPPITNRVAAVDPNTDLVDGQVVTVSWRNYIAGNTINIVQCADGGITGTEVCEFSKAQILQPNPTGMGSLQLEIVAGDVGSGRCDAENDNCVIVVNDGGLLGDEAIIRVPISFAP